METTVQLTPEESNLIAIALKLFKAVNRGQAKIEVFSSNKIVGFEISSKPEKKEQLDIDIINLQNKLGVNN